MKKVIKKSAIKKKQDGATMLDAVSARSTKGIPPERLAQMQRNAKALEYDAKKRQLQEEQKTFSKSLYDPTGGNRRPTVEELKKKQFFKDQIGAYNDSIIMNQKNISKPQIDSLYKVGRERKVKSKRGFESDMNYSPQSMGDAEKSSRAVDERGIKEGTKCKQGVESRRSQGASKNGTKIKKVTKTMKAKKYQAGGVVSSKDKKKAPMVDPKGAFTKVQQRTIAKKKTAVPKKKK